MRFIEKPQVETVNRPCPCYKQLYIIYPIDV